MTRPLRITCAVGIATAIVGFGFWLSGAEVSRGLGATITFAWWLFAVIVAINCPLTRLDDE